MVHAFDAAENIIMPNGASDDGLLVGWLVPGTEEVALSRKLNELPAFVNDTTSHPDWRTIYKDVPFRTDRQVKADAQEQIKQTRKQILTLRVMSILWLAVIPAAWATAQYFGSDWLARIVFAYALWQAFRTWRKLMGHVKPSRTEKEKADKERKMAHYFYHCERNPTGFARLKAENFEKDIREQTRKEADELAKKGRVPS